MPSHPYVSQISLTGLKLFTIPQPSMEIELLTFSFEILGKNKQLEK
jgi:hypothetical protein